MLLQALVAYAQSELSEDLEEGAFEKKPVRFVLALNGDGKLLALEEPTDPIQRGKKNVEVPRQMTIPKSPVNRNSGSHPLLAVDDIQYVLGVGEWTEQPQKEKSERHHAAFQELLRKAAGETQDTALESAVRFYDQPTEVEKARAALAMRKAGAGSQVALQVLGERVIYRPAVRQFWRDHYRRAFGERNEKGGEGFCLISGRFGPVAPTHNKIKGMASLGGQAAGVSLMSFDKSAFKSYGWDQNANSPVSPEMASAYVLALNHLLRPGNRSRFDQGNIAFVYWTREKTDTDLVGMLDRAEPEQVARLLKVKQDSLYGLRPNEFYFLGVSGNGGRLLVRYWLHETLDEAMGHVRNWFEGLRMVSAFTGQEGDPPKMWQLRAAIDRKGEPPTHEAVQLLRRAIHGEPLGAVILAAALDRLRRADGKERLRAERIGLIRTCVNDQDQKGAGMSERLDERQESGAYLCGRLLALYDSLQYAAQGEVNVTVADRYYSLASTYPALAFPKIADLGEKHKRKLRRDNRGALIRFDGEIGGIMTRLAKEHDAQFPKQLSLVEQGRFVIGYHHQRASSMAAAMAAKQQKRNSSETEGEQK